VWSQTPQDIDKLITKGECRLYAAIWLAEKQHFLDAQYSGGETLFGLADFRYVCCWQHQAALMVFASFAAGGEDVVYLLPLARPDGCCPTTTPIQVVRVGAKDDHYLSCHVFLHMAITNTTS
jgi:hypothetical protein